jgi:hypothetical protein
MPHLTTSQLCKRNTNGKTQPTNTARPQPASASCSPRNANARCSCAQWTGHGRRRRRAATQRRTGAVRGSLSRAASQGRSRGSPSSAALNSGCNAGNTTADPEHAGTCSAGTQLQATKSASSASACALVASRTHTEGDLGRENPKGGARTGRSHSPSPRRRISPTTSLTRGVPAAGLESTTR